MKTENQFGLSFFTYVAIFQCSLEFRPIEIQLILLKLTKSVSDIDSLTSI